MVNKWTAIVLTGAIAFTLAACGNEEREQGLAAATRDKEAAAATAETSYKSMYSSSVFLGDSITEGLSFHGMLDDKNVMGKAGATAMFALEDVDDLAGRNPKHVFIQLGSDDLLWPTDNPKQFSLANYAKLIEKIKEKLPKAKITILSVTPVTAEAEKSEPRYKNIADYNQGLKELAAKEKVGFTDVSPIFAAHPDLHDTDGIHMKAEYYTQLLKLLQDHVK
ncbi:GDSL-type esterase/lipase family protein [Paenibacillus ehimensis]|uniref:GDSL-type esterase/lipase family protein n=1 Tax=Paenibacillus ehimensis TaxID=79264 RepID=A0ABT8VDK2_9BACL|nr:GDSL-type esterase/lipase family protein [Paenibacillus ehimensis]MDO3679069.1 GDSL-type esterase/lipase family protein [Paenibacillus ehimensis]